MEAQEKELSTAEKLEGTISKDITQIDNNTLSMNELIDRISLLSENKNPYLVSQEIQEIKSIFYIKLRIEENEVIVSTKNNENKEKIKKELHPLEIEFKSVFNAYRIIKSDFRKKKEKEEEKNLTIKQEIIKDIDVLSKEEESIKTTFEKFRILQEKWRNTGNVPIGISNNLWQSYHHHVELFYDYIKLNNDLRELDFKRNLEEKNAIYKKAETLKEEKSLNRMHDSLQELHEHWKNVGPVKKELRQELWEKFQNISKQLNKKRNDYFLEKKRQDAEKLKLKEEICTEIDNLTSRTIDTHHKWKESTNRCNELEAKWKALGSIAKGNNKIAWKNLRNSLNIFYNKKNTFYKEKKETNKQILTNKIAICEKAENLQKNTDWQETTKIFFQLQEDWKRSGFISSTQSNKIWKRFRKSCDNFFQAKKTHYNELNKERESALKEKQSVLEEVKSFKKTNNSKEDIKTLKIFGNKWKDIGEIPVDKKKINKDFLTLLNSKFEELGLSKKALATEQYKNKISSIKGNKKAINNEQQFIREKIDALKRKISQYENNISFFVRGKSTKPLLKQAQKQIDNTKNKIEEFKQKLQLLNKL